MAKKKPEDRPKLRNGLAAESRDSGEFVLYDPLDLGGSIVLNQLAILVAERFDGLRTISEIANQIRHEYGQAEVSTEQIAGLSEALDQALLLDSPRFRATLNGPIRKPFCTERFSENPAAFRSQLESLFTANGGAGIPDTGNPARKNSLRAVLVPHMDYGRGNITYGHGFKELIENSDANVFVIIATSHYSPHRFTLTRQHFDTAFGLVKTDQAYVDRIAEHYGEGLFDDPVAHVPEHSIELEVVLLQYLLEGRRSFKIVPLLIGSMGDCVRRNCDPMEAEDIARMVSALRFAEARSRKRICYVISGDLAHIGPKFDDSQQAAGAFVEQSRDRDQDILRALESADPSAYYQVIAAEKDARRICGLSPTWLTLSVTRPNSGKVLHYQQYIHPTGYESVSFAAAAFYE